jgi:hypothetical protein
MNASPLSERETAEINEAVLGLRPLADVPAVRKLIEIERVRKRIWMSIALVFLAIFLYKSLETKAAWYPEPFKNEIIYQENSLFKKTRTVHCLWRKDMNGDLGWCTKTEGGEWYIFVDPLNPIYDEDNN